MKILQSTLIILRRKKEGKKEKTSVYRLSLSRRVREIADYLAATEGGDPESHYDEARRICGERLINSEGLQEVAEKLGGTVEGGRIVTPELVVLPSGYIYWTDLSWREANKRVAEAFGRDIANRASNKTAAGLKIWNETSDARGTLVEKYISSRGITLPIPDVVRFHGNLYYGPDEFYPAMVCGVADKEGKIVAVHRTFLNRLGTGKAPIDLPKKTLGPIGSGAIRLAPVAKKIAIAEGIETALSVMQATGLPCWSTISCNGMRQVILPVEVKEVVIAADGDIPGERAAMDLARRLSVEGRKVWIARAPAGRDFNDVLREEGSS